MANVIFDRNGECRGPQWRN